MMRRSPKGCCETLSKARLYAFTSVCNGIFVPGNVLAVRYVAMSPSLLCQANPKCGLPDFFRGTAVCRSQAFARAFRAGSVFVGTARCPRLRFIRRVPNAACQTSSETRLYAAYNRLHRAFRAGSVFVGTAVTSPSSFCQANPKCGLPGFFRGTAVWRSQAFARAFRAGSVFVGTARRVPVLFLFQAKRHIARASPFPTLQQHGPALTAACFMKAPKSADGSAMRQPYRQKAAFALFPTWDLQKWRWQRLCQMRMAVAANKKTASTLCCEGNSDGHCRPPGSRRNGRFPVHALPALPNRSSFSVTARFMASRARQTPSV